MLMSASAMAPVSGLKKTRVRAVVEPGVSSELQKEIAIVRLGQRIRWTVCGAGSNSEESRVSSRSPAPRARNKARLAMMTAGYCIQSFLERTSNQQSLGVGSWGADQRAHRTTATHPQRRFAGSER